MRRSKAQLLALLMVLSLSVSAAVIGTATSALAGSRATSSPKKAASIIVGSVTLTSCDVVDGAYCGSISRAWDPAHSGLGNLSVGFAFVPALDTSQPALGTLVPHEGGPGFSTTGTGADYAAMYGSLSRRRNLLLVDQRGTGRSAPIDCPDLQVLTGAYDVAAQKCGAQLGDHSDLYGSALSADDLSAVITALGLGKVDLYGDSYGTFFTQVFLGRHPSQARSVILDSAYPTYGENAWYGTQGSALRSSLATVCRRTPSCAAVGGSATHRLSRLLDVVRRHPLRGKATGSDGKQHTAKVDGAALVLVAFEATYGPATYRELDPAVRAALHGDPAPILRLYAEDEFTGDDNGPADAYSEGLDAAVSCQDYPQLYDLSASLPTRATQYANAVATESTNHPTVYGPFTVKEYLASDWEEQDWCLKWPAPSSDHPAGPPTPVGGHYSAVPTLVLSGELDTITTPAEGTLITQQIPGARQVIVANSFHVTALDDTDGCGAAIVRQFVRAPTAAIPASERHCAAHVAPVRGAPAYRKSFRHNGSGSLRTRAARTAALTVADTMDRWLQSLAGRGTGLRGGTWGSSGYDVAHLRLHSMRLASNLAVSGKVTWDRYAHQTRVHLTVRQVGPHGHPVHGSGVNGTLSGHWNTRVKGSHVHLTGTLGGQHVHPGFLAP